MPAFLDGLFISEILADNVGGSGFDTDGDGGSNKSDEYIEIQNATGSTIDLSNYQLWSQTNGLLFDFASVSPPDPTPTVAPGETATVVGEYSGTPPSGFFDSGDNNGQNFIPDGETVGSQNRADVIYLVNATTGDYIFLSYGSNPLTVSPPPGFPGTNEVDGEVFVNGAPNSTAFVRDANGEFVTGSPDPGNAGPVCFCAGTRITTEQGDIAVEHLMPGARILTKDHGLVPLRALRAAPLGRQVLRLHPDARPVHIPLGVVGNNRGLNVSPAHRVLIRAALAELYFGTPEVLVSARQLARCGLANVSETQAPAHYHHLLFDDHQIIRANGCWSESLFLGDTAHWAITAASGWRVQSGWVLSDCTHRCTARTVLKGYEAGQLLRVLGLEHASYSVAA
ncbi:Hint domain-containing protein [Cognatiyoonia sp. IB215182]|uniref:Hint domain-containing protein n=1 Tax=Cognatiyoonia sp. IB215182 TaxID=3097353 RepID=UPI002A172DD0|nr:Hint domain-containing protein [Cognatiyoonia sp. IB215182]MDX8351578.1 Hint domain-containing protein [Cognatiyoonia sp. IB215182]